MRRKLVLSLIMVCACIISIVSSTFAFIVINTDTPVEEFEFNIEGQSGIQISIDGKNFSQDITAKQVKEAVSGSVDAFDKTMFTGVTLKHDANKKIEMVDNNPVFVKDNLDENKNHIMVDATKNKDYISFDLWLRIDNTTSDKSDYNIKFTDNTWIKADDYSTALVNTLTTQDKTYTAGDVIKVNPANSMRLGVVKHQDSSDLVNVYEVEAKSGASDLGSVAIEGGTGKNDPSKNAMYTYYNSLHPLYPFTKASDDGLEGFSSGVIKNDYTIDAIDSFKYVNEDYNDIHLTILIWLEGWDADYISSLPASRVSVSLEFEMVG